MKNTILLLFLSLSVLSGCSITDGIFGSSSSSSGTLITETRDTELIPGTRVVELDISRDKLKASMENSAALQNARIVQIYSSASISRVPEYRLFSLEPDGPYALMGLQNGDILVAANEYVLYNPLKFKQYLYLLQNEKEAQIEIRRDGQPLLFKYTIS